MLLLGVGTYKFHKDFHFTYAEKAVDTSQGHQPHILPIQAALGDNDEQQLKFVKRPKKGSLKKRLDLGDTKQINKLGLDRTKKVQKPVEIDNNNKNEEISLKEKRKSRMEETNEIRPIQGNQIQEHENDERQRKQHQKISKNKIGNEKLNSHKDETVDTKDDIIKVPSSSKHNSRQRSVVEAFKHAWKAYKAHAWGEDELRPLSRGSKTWFDIGLTLIDSLDTMWLMDLKEDFNEARDWVKRSLRFDKNRYVNLFEVTIRVLGSLLSTFNLTGDKEFLNKAVSILCRWWNVF